MSTTIPFHIALGSIENPSADWGQVRRRLAQLTEVIDTLTTERQLLQTALDSVVYPVLTLPPEITSNIFLQSIPEDATPSRHASPLLLTQICHQWRAIALATPGLWQSIALEHVWQPTGCHCTALLQMWLQYSTTRPLFLSFGCEVQMQRLIDTSLIHCHRWQEITLSSHVTLTAPHTHFPILRKVTLARHIGGTVVIHNAPELRQANFRTVPTFVVALPWARLTSLAVQTFAHASDCLPMLIHCSNLRHLTHSAVAYRGGGFALPHATLDSLQSLTLGVNSSGLMPHLTLPHLRHLTLIGKFLTTTREHLQALLWRSSCTLLRMSVILDGGEDSSPAGLRSLLQVVPTVTDLTLTVRSSLHLHHAVGPLTSPDTLPLMGHLCIEAPRVTDYYDSLLDMLRHRRTGRAHLTSFELSLQLDINPDSPSASTPFPALALAQFRDLAVGGLQTRIRAQGEHRNSVLLDTFAFPEQLEVSQRNPL